LVEQRENGRGNATVQLDYVHIAQDDVVLCYECNAMCPTTGSIGKSFWKNNIPGEVSIYVPSVRASLELNSFTLVKQ